MAEDDFFGGAYTDWTELDHHEVAQLIAASFNTLVRGWCYDPEGDRGGSNVRGELELDPWVVETADAAWLARGQRTLDLAVTWWDDLPSDWQERFVEQGEVAAHAIREAVDGGRAAEDLVTDEPWLAALGEQLQRPWLRPRRVIGLEGGVVDVAAAGATLATEAVNVYAWTARMIPSTLGTVRGALPSALPKQSETFSVGGFNPSDEKYVSFCITGERLTVEVANAIEGLVGRKPNGRWYRGGLRLQRNTGRQYRPYPSGYWGLSSEHDVSKHDATLQEHLEWLLDLLEPSAVELRGLITTHELEAQFFCFYSQTGYNADWELSAQTVSRIGALGASFRFDSYAAWDDDEDDEASEAVDVGDDSESVVGGVEHDRAAEPRP